MLVVDDSAVARRLIAMALGSDPTIEVVLAADPVIAATKIEQTAPDVILLDLEMPRMDGLSFLRRLMAEHPIPTVVCSAVAAPGTEAALRALADGAVEILEKPRWRDGALRSEWTRDLLRTIRAAALARVAKRKSTPQLPLRRGPPHAESAARRGSHFVVAIGASTGGPEALTTLLRALPADGPGIVIAQHMPAAFTGALARHLDSVSEIRVREAADGDAILDGHALVAPGDRHVVVLRTGGRFSVSVLEGPRIGGHRPSVDVLFRSVARAAGPHAVGVELTGMGADGAEGLLAMRRAGAWTLAQDAETCVVFGMPREAIARGAAAMVLPLERIPGAIVASVRRNGRRGPSDADAPPRLSVVGGPGPNPQRPSNLGGRRSR
ncbi:Protein-glutamate methylesterase/protein-glutamine glutaminase [Myxococcaceae bacterium]|nr:Protein-glutamate methylesterase/protein-glutamine glutaminase [Myxococcaceae bacterium]